LHAPVPTEVLDELMAASAKIDADRMATIRALSELSAAGGGGAEVIRRAIAGVECMNDATRELIRRIDRLLEEFEFGRSDRS
jgi:hypothetical protein